MRGITAPLLVVLSPFLGAVAKEVQSVGLGAVERQHQDQAVIGFFR